MNRKINTDFYEFTNPNPHNKIAGDCVIRALSLAMNKSWLEVYDDLCELGRKYGYMPNDRQTYERYLKNNGWIKCSEPRNWDNTKMSVKAFCEYNHEGNIIARVGSHHICAIINNKVHDIWNSSAQTMHTYWKQAF